MSQPRRIAIGSGQAESVVWIGAGLLSTARRYLASPSGRFLLVTCAGARRPAQRIRAALSGRILADIEIDDHESEKTLAAVSRIADAALAAGVRRDDALVAVGGGVVCDVAGFAAAILLRGIAWSAVPTTTGAMADAAIGGKTGVDHAAGKNLLGAFHPPRAVLIDPEAAATLPDRDFRAGLVEAFKAAWIADAEFAKRAEDAIEGTLRREESPLLDLLAGSAAIKAAIVSEDLKEEDRRRLLNFGHTLGHAFEAAGGYRDLRHGEAVAWGIAAALEISRVRAGLREEEALRVRRVLRLLGPFPEPVRDPNVLAPYLSRDKKGSARGIAGVVLEAVGRARIDEAIPLEDWLKAAVHAGFDERRPA
ncbi:MAG TPA: 3-dehydroquinate synthase family protein [Thermoanaerobaculia bacterium]|nr:3-dehydroquinate synthase family protein [Thermoanaerobaculia bacterium]